MLPLSLSRVLKTKASEVSKLTPQVIGHAEEVVRDPAGTRRLEELQLSSHQWAGHVGQLIEATQKANYPWSKTAERLVAAAKKGKGLEAQVSPRESLNRAHHPLPFCTNCRKST